MNQNKILVVITTYNREDDFWKTYNSVDYPDVDILVLQDAMREFPYSPEFAQLEFEEGVSVRIFEENKGIGFLKQHGFDHALKHGYQHVFIVEDDVVITDNDIWMDSIEWSEKTGLKHFNWNSCLDNKVDYVVEHEDGFNVRVNENASGNFSYFDISLLEAYSLDPEYFNALEHVDLEYQLSLGKKQPPFWCFCSPHILDSFLDSPNCKNSTIVGRSDQKENVKNAIGHWIKKWGKHINEIPHTPRYQVERSLALIREKEGIPPYPDYDDEIKKKVSIICTIKDRCIIRYISKNDLLPQECQILGNHDKLIKSVESDNAGKGGVVLNSTILADPQGMRPFDNFLKSLNEQADRFDGEVELVVVDWSSEDDNVEDIIEFFWKKKEYQYINLDGKQKFSRGYGLDVGAKAATGKVLHFTDIDMKYHTPRFLEDAALLDGEAIFPMIYKEQSPSGLTLYLEIAGFGISSMEKGVYLNSGGYPDIRKWGGEDNALFEKVEKLVGSGNVKRSVYHECIHQWHSNKLR